MYSMYVAESDVRDIAPIEGDEEDTGDGTDTSQMLLFSDDISLDRIDGN